MTAQRDSWQVDEKLKKDFLDQCVLAATNDEAFVTFRSMSRIHTVIENTNFEWAFRALVEMPLSFYSFFVHNWASKPTITQIRYLYTLHLADKLHIPISSAQGTIVEIGAGYGGFREIIHKCYGSNYPYIIYDLPEVQMLQKRYLGQWGIEAVYMNGIEPLTQEVDTCISWCGWSELHKEAKQEYIDKVICKAKHIFICSNYNMEEDKTLLKPYFPNLKEYSDDLVAGLLYC